MAHDSFRRLSVLMATVFVDMLGFSIAFSQLPFYTERFGGTPTLVGLLISTFALAKLVTSPWWGKLSDRYGRRPAILSGLVASVVAFLLFGLAASEAVEWFLGPGGALWVLFASRRVQGASGGTVGVIQAYVSDSSQRQDRAKILGWVTAASSAGVMIGPALGSLAFRLGPEAPGYLAAGFCLANLASAWRWLPEPERQRAATHPDGAPRPSIRRAVRGLLAEPGSPVATLIWTYALGMLAFMSLNGVLALYLNRAFGIDETTIGWFYLYVAGITLVMRALLIGPIVRALGEVWTLRLGALAIATGLLTIPLASNLLTLAVVAIFIPVGTALLFPATTSLVSQRAEAHEMGQTLGVQQAFGSTAQLLGPLWSTAVFERVGTGAPFWATGALMLAVCLYTLRIAAPPEEASTREPPAPPAPLTAGGEPGAAG
jgi:MFS family permease